MPKPAKRVNQSKAGKPKESLYQYLVSYWAISTATAYQWINKGWPVENLTKLCALIIKNSRAATKPRKKAHEVLAMLRAGQEIVYCGKTYTSEDAGGLIEDENPDEFLDVDPIKLDELIDWLGKRIASATAKNRIDIVTELQPLYLKAVESRDRTDLAAKKLGIDSMEMIPRPKFVKLLQVIGWTLCQRSDVATVRLAKAATGHKTVNDAYNAIHPIVFKQFFESPFCEVAHHATHLELPDWVMDEVAQVIADNVEDGKRKLRKYLGLKKK